MNREDVEVARCTVERLMRTLGLQGARRGKAVRTTWADPKAVCPLDKVHRQFKGECQKLCVRGGGVGLWLCKGFFLNGCSASEARQAEGISSGSCGHSPAPRQRLSPLSGTRMGATDLSTAGGK
jgi:hypothetical protein